MDPKTLEHKFDELVKTLIMSFEIMSEGRHY